MVTAVDELEGASCVPVLGPRACGGRPGWEALRSCGSVGSSSGVAWSSASEGEGGGRDDQACRRARAPKGKGTKAYFGGSWVQLMAVLVPNPSPLGGGDEREAMYCGIILSMSALVRVSIVRERVGRPSGRPPGPVLPECLPARSPPGCVHQVEAITGGLAAGFAVASTRKGTETPRSGGGISNNRVDFTEPRRAPAESHRASILEGVLTPQKARGTGRHASIWVK